MNEFLKLPADKRRVIYEQVSLRMGINDAKAIEKCLTLAGIAVVVLYLAGYGKNFFRVYFFRLVQYASSSPSHESGRTPEFRGNREIPLKKLRGNY